MFLFLFRFFIFNFQLILFKILFFYLINNISFRYKNNYIVIVVILFSQHFSLIQFFSFLL